MINLGSRVARIDEKADAGICVSWRSAQHCADARPLKLLVDSHGLASARRIERLDGKKTARHRKMSVIGFRSKACNEGGEAESQLISARFIDGESMLRGSNRRHGGRAAVHPGGALAGELPDGGAAAGEHGERNSERFGQGTDDENIGATQTAAAKRSAATQAKRRDGAPRMAKDPESLRVIHDQAAPMGTPDAHIVGERRRVAAIWTVTVGDKDWLQLREGIAFKKPAKGLGIVMPELMNGGTEPCCSLDAPPPYRIESAVEENSDRLPCEDPEQIPEQMKGRSAENTLFAPCQPGNFVCDVLSAGGFMEGRRNARGQARPWLQYAVWMAETEIKRRCEVMHDIHERMQEEAERRAVTRSFVMSGSRKGSDVPKRARPTPEAAQPSRRGIRPRVWQKSAASECTPSTN